MGWMLVATGCYSLSERPGGPLPVFPYQEVMSRTNTEYLTRFSPEELAECPRLNGVFKNLSSVQNKAGYDLTYFLRAVGLKNPATSYPGGRPEDPPVPMSAPIELLFSHSQEGLIHPPYVNTYDLTSIELRPLGNAHFKARITHRQGTTVEGIAEFRLYRANSSTGGMSTIVCEQGQVKATYNFKFAPSKPAWRLYEEPETGDILVVNTTPEHAGEITSRFKRIGH